MTETKKRVPEQLKSGFICVDSYDNKCFTGSVFYPAIGRETPFSSAMQLLDAVDAAVKELGYVGEFCERRQFFLNAEAPAPAHEAQPGKPPRGALATFAVKIVFMQNATWQGTLLWQENGEEQSFRSVLELLGLMDSVLTRGV